MNRVAALEAKVGSKSVEEQFREQVLDWLFAQRFQELDNRWGPPFARMELACVVQTDVSTLKRDVSTLKGDVSALKGDISVLQQDMAIVREGVAIC